MRKSNLVYMLLVAAVLAVSSAGALAAGDEKMALSGAGKEPLYVAGPFTWENLSVYVFYRSRESGAGSDYITLEEGLRKGLVTVTERPRERVAALEVSNASDLPLFLQAGELLRGGRQDRTLGVSLVVPAHTEAMEIPAFCVEQSRWRGEKTFAAQGVIAPRSVRQAMADNDQEKVWGEVSEYKSRAAAGVARANESTAEPSSSTSINEQLAGRMYKRAVGGYEDKLSGAIDKVDYPVGIAWAVGGRFSTADIYTSVDLFRKLFPELLRTAASEALAAAAARERDPDPPTQREIADTITAAWEGKETKLELPGDNIMLRLRTDSATASQLFFKRELVHTEVMSAPPRKVIAPLPPPRPLPPIIRPSPPRPPIRPMDLDDLWRAH